MRINTNVASLNSNRVLQLTNTAVARTLGRLSSGYRINRSADDAAGLGIANKLRADLRSLRQAARNAEQANAMLQIAEGAAQSIQSIVERMKELATQAASANTDDNGRAKIQDEFGKLIEEIDRIVATTKFQDTALLDGTFQGDFMVSSSGAYTP
ncbi:MAG: flagellin, partial [bacterium]